MESKSQHISDLAQDLLDDIELGRLGAEELILKATRLARLAGSDEVRAWLKFEVVGYNEGDPIALEYMSLTGRWTDYKEKKGFWGPLAQQEASIETYKHQLSSMRTPDVSGDFARLAIDSVTRSMNQTSLLITQVSAVRSRVLGLLHDFVSSVYYERKFEGLAESIFERYQGNVDTLLAAHCGPVLEKIPSVMERLAEGEPESISQALATCRRIIDAFADSIYPPTEATIELGGNVLSLGPGKYLNRINAYVAERVGSKSRCQKIRQNLSNLYDRVSSGVHADVDAGEAQALFLNTYLLLGEILRLERGMDGQALQPG